MENNSIKINIAEYKKTYDIIIGTCILNQIDKYFNVERSILIVTDDNIPYQFIRSVSDKAKHSLTITIPHGERNKNIENYKNILQILTNNNFTRNDAIIAIGGGMIGDMAAFAASTYMRGIDFYNIPTTLLSQVDSSIGGKTAIDFMGIKNIIGTFYQPKGVLIDVDTLKTLPKRELHSGLVESIKMAVTFDKNFFSYLESNPDIISNAEKIIHSSLEIKKMVVEQDEKERGLRKVLNFGHTIGHAIEEVNNCELLHGECVGLGMLYFSSPDIRDRLKKLLSSYDLPTECNFDKNAAIELIQHDKKSIDNCISTIQVKDIGNYSIVNITFDEISTLLSGYN